jgi:hypothetical protein
MAIVEIPLNSFRYRFRQLTWPEEFEIKFPAGEDQRKILLAHALVDISGLPITSVADATRVLSQIPPAIFWRIWIVYRGNSPADRYFTSKGLYNAPDQKTYNKRLLETEQRVEVTADDAIQQMELREAREIESQIFAQAKAQGRLVRVQEG